MQPTLRAVDARAVHAWDGFVLFWMALWTALGLWTGVTLWQASATGDTISTSGDALSTVGAGLESLAEVPVIGDRPGEIGQEVSATAIDITERGQAIKGELRRLALLLGVATVAIPIMPVGGFYVPARLAWRRHVREVDEAIQANPDDRALDRYLAGRARAGLSWPDLRDLTGHEGNDALADRDLADAYLARIGLTRPALG